MKLKVLWVIAILSSALASCSKNDDQVSTSNPSKIY